MELIPSYRCNFKCPFCVNYKNDQSLLMDLDWLERELDKLPKCNKMDILGGEPGLLEPAYLERIISIAEKHSKRTPGMYSNLYIIPPFIDRVTLCVSFDPGTRPHADTVFQNMLLLEKPFSINMIFTKHVTDIGVEKLLRFAKRLKNLKQIKLSTLTSFPECPDLRPDPESFIKFCSDVIQMDKERLIHFYPIDTWRDGYVKDFEPIETMEVLPNNRFLISLRDFESPKEFDTFDEAAEYYLENYKKPSGKCIGCPYFRRCPNMYEGTSCIDKKITKEIIRLEHLC